MYNWPEQGISSLDDIRQLGPTIGASWPNADRCLFRGQSNAGWTLQHSLSREIGTASPDLHTIFRIEREMANQFRQEAHRGLSPVLLPKYDRVFDWLPLMRHYGAPTRLLDWSLSPYVALYFAVAQSWDEDGTLWWFHANVADGLMTAKFGATYLDFTKQLFQATDTEPFFAADLPPILFPFELKRTFDRVGNQQGFFTVCLDPLIDHADILGELTTYSNGPHCGKLVVPKQLKPRLLSDLHLMNVTGKSMFPGLDGLGRTLTELTKLSVLFGVP